VVTDEELPKAQVINLLRSLVDKSLVVTERSAGGIRYRLLEQRENARAASSRPRPCAPHADDTQISFDRCSSKPA
jgi:hypothetical protein